MSYSNGQYRTHGTNAKISVERRNNVLKTIQIVVSLVLKKVRQETNNYCSAFSKSICNTRTNYIYPKTI